ncbi:MAG: zf-HC2 domain-containing protein [Nitriliruptoraceae bacterium]
MTAPDPHVHTELGAYVLGALEPVDRHRVEGHLADCASCRDELSELSVMPALLDRLSPEEAMTSFEGVDRLRSGTVERSSAAERRRYERALRRWRWATSVAAAAAAILAVFVWTPWEGSPDRLVVQVVALAGEPQTVEGTVAAYAWEWGTTVELEVASLPAADAYAIWAISETGHRERAGTWGPTAHRSARVRGASAIPRDQLARVEVTDLGGEPLFAADFAGEGAVTSRAGPGSPG